ncbi:MAG: DsrE family protein [Clostridiales bacterium]|nr:DsrE family protein [Clostridiales bacterium]
MKLKVVWTSGEKEVALKMVHMYVYNAKINNWWDDIELIIWGPSSKLLADDEELQVSVKSMLTKNIKVVACQACTDSYHISDQLRTLGIEVKYMGVLLTDYLKSDMKVITF